VILCLIGQLSVLAFVSRGRRVEGLSGKVTNTDWHAQESFLNSRVTPN
jgi:hypothetical protein